MTTPNELKRQWNTHINQLERMKWNLPMEHHEELEDHIEKLKDLVEKAAEEKKQEMN